MCDTAKSKRLQKLTYPGNEFSICGRMSPQWTGTVPFLDKSTGRYLPLPTFLKSELASAVQAVENNTQHLNQWDFQPIQFVSFAVECGGPKNVHLCQRPKSCKHRIKLGDFKQLLLFPFSQIRIHFCRILFTHLLLQQDIETAGCDQMFGKKLCS